MKLSSQSVFLLITAASSAFVPGHLKVSRHHQPVVASITRRATFSFRRFSSTEDVPNASFMINEFSLL